MEIIQVQYVGTKPSRDDNVADTGLVWTPGEIHPVPELKAKKLLAHPDIWQSVGSETVVGNEPVETVKKKEVDIEPPYDLANLDAMNKADLAKYSHKNFGVQLDPATKKDAMVAKIKQLQVTALQQQALEQEQESLA